MTQIILKNKFYVKVTFIDSFNMKLETDPYTLAKIRKHFTRMVKGAEFSQPFKNYLKSLRGEPLFPGARIWDGMTCFMQGNKLAIGLLQELVSFCNIEKNIILVYQNFRETLIPKYTNITEDFLSGIKLRDYQIEAAKQILSSGFGIIKIATGGGKCVTGDTKIKVRLHEGGCKFETPITIKSLFSSKDLYKKAEVLTDKGYKQIENIFNIPKQKLMRLETKDGKKLTASEDHRVMTTSGWKKLKHILKTDKIIVYKCK